MEKSKTCIDHAGVVHANAGGYNAITTALCGESDYNESRWDIFPAAITCKKCKQILERKNEKKVSTSILLELIEILEHSATEERGRGLGICHQHDHVMFTDDDIEKFTALKKKLR